MPQRNCKFSGRKAALPCSDYRIIHRKIFPQKKQRRLRCTSDIYSIPKSARIFRQPIQPKKRKICASRERNYFQLPDRAVRRYKLLGKKPPYSIQKIKACYMLGVKARKRHVKIFFYYLKFVQPAANACVIVR